MRTRFLFFLLLLSPILFKSVSAQQIEWQRTIGGADSDRPRTIQQTSDGGFICGGYSHSNIGFEKTENCLGSSDYWVLKLDATGNIIWQNTIGGADTDGLSMVYQCSDGSYIVGGDSNSDISIDKSENSRGDFDFWIVKLDTAGIIEWDKTIGGSGRDKIEVIHQSADGGFYCAGYSNSDSSGDKSENSNGFNDIWIVKLDFAGNIQWQNTIGGNLDDYLYAGQPTTDGGYICGGESNSDISGDKTEDAMMGTDIWLVKLDSLGNIQWQNTIGGNNLDHCMDIMQTNDGGYIFGGTSQSPASFDKLEDNITAMADYWIIKTDSVGNLQWQNTIGGSEYEESLDAIFQTSDGGYVCGGTSRSEASGDKAENCMGSFDFWILKLDQTGNIQFQNTIGGSDTEYLESMVQTSDGGYIFTGMTYSGISGDKTDICRGDTDFWILKLDGKYNLVQGTAFYDTNNNNIKDPGEESAKQKKINETTTGLFSYTNNAGAYSLAVMDSGNFEISSEPQNYYSAVPLNYSVYFIGFLQTDSLKDFAFQSTGNFNDLCATISPIGPFRSGMNASYQLNYTNQGTTSLNPTIVFYPDDNVNYLSANVTPTSVTPDSIVFVAPLLAPFQSGQILVTVSINSGLPIGTVVNSCVLVLPVIGDADPACNQSCWEVNVIGSYDPNDILVNRDTLFDYELTTPPFLEYLIRFQNTGNDTAFYIRLDNRIASYLQLSTLEFVSSSHPCDIEYQVYDSTLKFIFKNIFLPDSNINEPASHGFVRYKIKPLNSLIVGDSILNNAAIVFDYNPPVITDTVVTEITLPTSINELLNSNMTVYPNPVANELTIELNGTQNEKIVIELNNIYGQKVRSLYSGTIDIGNWREKFDIRDLTSGVYILTISGKEQATQKIIKL